MGLLDMFKKSDSKAPAEEKKVMPWIGLTQVSQLDSIKENSKGKTQLIFKDSTRCGISKMVIRQFMSNYSYEDQIDAYYLDLLNYRSISQEIAARFQVMHQSPQLIVVKNGVVIHHASHHDIRAENLAQYI